MWFRHSAPIKELGRPTAKEQHPQKQSYLCHKYRNPCLTRHSICVFLGIHFNTRHFSAHASPHRGWPKYVRYMTSLKAPSSYMDQSVWGWEKGLERANDNKSSLLFYSWSIVFLSKIFIEQLTWKWLSNQQPACNSEMSLY